MRFVKTAENLFGLPSGFTRVEYLQSSGTQYIDTGIKGTQDTEIQCGFNVLDYTQTDYVSLMGYIGNSDESISVFLGRNSGNGRTRFGNASTLDTAASLNTSYDLIINKSKLQLNSNVLSWDCTNTFTTEGDLLLFRRNSETYGNFIGRIRYCKIYDNDTLVRDFIPCIDPLGRACMYDLVGKKSYYNQGTGEFTVGRQIIPVEYLESTGTQYIDTDVEAKFSTKLSCGYMTTNSTDRQRIFGNVVASRNCVLIECNGNTRFSDKVFSVRNNNLNTVYNCVLDKTSFVVNDVQQTTWDNPEDFGTASTKIFLFRSYASEVLPFFGRIYYAKVYDNSVLARDFIPCKDENNVGFMFDTVSGMVYENAGTGAFVVGGNKYNMKLRLIRDNILPTGYTQLEYIEAENGGGNLVEYAVGNYRLTNTTDWEITFSASSSGNNWVMGQPTWIGVHYRKDATTSNLPRVGIVNSAAAANQCYVDYTDNEKITLTLKGTDVYANGVKVGSITRVSAPAAQTKYGLFAYKDINQALPNLRIPSARIYRLKLWDNDVLVQDLIPAMKNGVAGFYERVNKTFIEKESNSTSDFTTGNPLLPIVRFPVDIVPAGYKAMNYLESSGTQYIDTGVAGSSTLKIEMEGQKASAGYGVYFGAGTGNNRIQAIYVSNQNSARIGNLTTNLGPDSEKFNVVVDTLNKNVIYNGTSYSFAYTSALTTLNIFIFTRNEGGSFADTATAKCWYCKIYDNNTLVRNFIPVVRLLDNKAGMWDTVTKQFYTTPVGDFITG